tara:strand:+ start:203 stop:307 length:105 start_codon:yes stop_codon:yes gene_type:complete
MVSGKLSDAGAVFLLRHVGLADARKTATILLNKW